jgi:lipopolysaccharide/colanic/teichoic acid biosynthesis glycosyltransferase
MSHQFYAWAEERSRVHPGLTGLWQISGRSDVSFEEMMRLDLEYIRSWSLALDLSIILETPLSVLKGIGAY